MTPDGGPSYPYEARVQPPVATAAAVKILVAQKAHRLGPDAQRRRAAEPV
jgi:hypothetical protein